MILGGGIELVGPKDHAAALSTLHPLVDRPDTRIYAVDTFWQSNVTSSHDLVRCILDSMQVWDWYGYRFEVSLSQCLTAPGVRIHIVMVALNESAQPVLTDTKLMRILEEVHRHALRLGKQFRTVFFLEPLAGAAPRL